MQIRRRCGGASLFLDDFRHSCSKNSETTLESSSLLHTFELSHLWILLIRFGHTLRPASSPSADFRGQFGSALPDPFSAVLTRSSLAKIRHQGNRLFNRHFWIQSWVYHRKFRRPRSLVEHRAQIPARRSNCRVLRRPRKSAQLRRVSVAPQLSFPHQIS
jgi:hypothetical protein